MSNLIDSIREYEQNKRIMEDIEMLKRNGLYGKVMVDGEPHNMDTRYNVPKKAPKASEELVEETIMNTEIYRRARLAIVQSEMLSGETRTAILHAQSKQVAYGLDKYPEPLNPNTWTIGETVEHIMDESIDRLHYLIMLRIKMEQSIVNGAFNDILEVRNNNSRIMKISHMISNTIEELNYLVNLVIVTDKETEARPDDSFSSLAYAMQMMPNYKKVAPCNLMNVNLSGADMDGDTLRVFSDDEMRLLAETGKAEL